MALVKVLIATGGNTDGSSAGVALGSSSVVCFCTRQNESFESFNHLRGIPVIGTIRWQQVSRTLYLVQYSYSTRTVPAVQYQNPMD